MGEKASARFPDNLPDGWREKLKGEAEKPYFQQLTKFLRTEYQAGRSIFPRRERVLRALQSLDYPDVKVVILGQDPYHGEGQALGLSFAVPNALLPKPPSLVNIFKEIESDLGKPIDRSCSELNQWVSQGVLLLNTVLTVRKGEAFSHRNQGWENLTDRISVCSMSEKSPSFSYSGARRPDRKKPLSPSRNIASWKPHTHRRFRRTKASLELGIFRSRIRFWKRWDGSRSSGM